MNNIPKKQNEPEGLQKLAAVRSLYSSAKTVLVFQFLLSVPISITGAVIALLYPACKGYAMLIGVGITILNLAWLNPWQIRLRKLAANIQEAFDCYLLELEWNPVKAGHRPMPELIKDRADRYYLSRGDMPPLRDWYPIVAGAVPIEMARVICQRENCVWDSKQRRAYATAMVSFIAVCVFAVIVVSIIEGLTVEKLFLSVIGPLAPAIIFAWQQDREHLAAAARLDELRTHADELVDAVLDGVTNGFATARSRSLQDEILDSRQRNAPVFDWVFKLLRPNYEAQMRYGAKDLVNRMRRTTASHNTQG